MPGARLTAATVLDVLRERRLLDVPEARVSVTEIIRRNHNFAISVDGRPAWFVKQVQCETSEVIASQCREARMGEPFIHLAGKTARSQRRSRGWPRPLSLELRDERLLGARPA